jgi:hypothetical protein
MRTPIFLFLFCSIITGYFAQPLARDTLTVYENGKVLKMPWANGINYANASNIDLDGDNVKDLVMFDRVNQFGTGRFRCFIKKGSAGQVKYEAAPQLSYYFPQCSNWAVLLDYNCDGKEDLFCSTSAGIKVYCNTSTTNGPNFTVLKSLLYTDYGGNNGKSNLYASSVGVPGISDIDGDGDLDVLTFSPQGVLIEFHKNMSKELGFNCDSLIYQAVDLCWGKISESQCTVTMNQCLPRVALVRGANGEKEYHAGSCLMCLDADGDLDQDLVMGDISCNTVHYVHNTGTNTNAFFSDTTALYPNYPNTSSTTQLKMNNFPCTYYVDVDGDNKRDLVATPNAAGSENYKSVWFYKNTSLTATVNFQFVQTNLLQDEMIEVGQDAFPVTLDYDADGKKDLLIGTFGYYQNNNLSARLTLYRNMSTNAVPVYSLITRDYANLSAQNLSNVMPTVGDIDNDGDQDILIGTSTGQIHWLKNSAGNGNPCNFSQFISNPFTFTTSSAVAAPQLFDLDGDNLLDLMIGTKNGRLNYYRNTGTSSAASFSLLSNFLGNVDVKGDPYLYGLDGYAVPYFYRENGNTFVMVGSISGAIWHYSVPSNPLTNFNLISNGINGYNEGSQSSVMYEDIDGDTKRDLMIGNGSGGLSYFSSSSSRVGIKAENRSTTSIHFIPNPAKDVVEIFVNSVYDVLKVEVLDLSGRVLLERSVSSSAPFIDLSEVCSGVYFCKVQVISSEGSFTQIQKLLRD